MKRKQTKHENHFERIEKSRSFRQLMKEKKAFFVPSIIFFMLFYFSLPVLAVYTTVLEGKVLGEITWAWVLAVAQFIMTWTLCIIYVKKAAHFDQLADEVIQENSKQQEKEGTGL